MPYPQAPARVYESELKTKVPYRIINHSQLKN